MKVSKCIGCDEYPLIGRKSVKELGIDNGFYDDEFIVFCDYCESHSLNRPHRTEKEAIKQWNWQQKVILENVKKLLEVKKCK